MAILNVLNQINGHRLITPLLGMETEDDEFNYIIKVLLPKKMAEAKIAENEEAAASVLADNAKASAEAARKSAKKADLAADLAEAADNGTVSVNTPQLDAALVIALNTSDNALQASIEAANTLTRSPEAKKYDYIKVSVNTSKIAEASKASELAAEESAKAAELAPKSFELAAKAASLSAKASALAAFAAEYAIGLKGLSSLYKTNSETLLLKLNAYIESLKGKNKSIRYTANLAFIEASRAAKDANHSIDNLHKKYISNLGILGIVVNPQKGGRSRRKRRTKRRKNKRTNRKK